MVSQAMSQRLLVYRGRTIDNEWVRLEIIYWSNQSGAALHQNSDQRTLGTDELRWVHDESFHRDHIDCLIKGSGRMSRQRLVPIF